MLEVIKSYLRSMVKSRIFIVGIIYFLLFGTVVVRLYYLQIIQGEQYEEEANYQSEKTRELQSKRGNIYDCNGKLLATNEQSYAVTYEDTGEVTDSKTRNAMIAQMINIIEDNGDKLDLDFYIVFDKKGRLKWKGQDSTIRRFKKDIYYKKSSESLTEEQENASAQDIFDYLRYDTSSNTPKFNIDDTYDKEMALKIMTVRYAMMMNTYSKYLPITISSDVNDKTVAGIKESTAELPGVEVTEQTHRIYNYSEYFAHIIGYTGLISADSLAEMKEEDPNTPYSATDQIGKTGIEKEYENILRGTKGVEKLTVNNSYQVVDIISRTESVAGNDIYLTIDADLQEAAYKILEKKIAGILISKIVNSENVGTKVKKSDNIRVSIYDVYDAIIQNNVVDLEKFNDEGASSLEKSLYSRYKAAFKTTKAALKTQLNINYTLCGKQISEKDQEYMNYIYKFLVNKGVLLYNNIDKTDERYGKFIENKLSTSQFLSYAISKNWIDLDTLDVGDEYYSTEELYDMLIKYVITNIEEDSEFNKMIYHYLIQDHSISGKEVCQLLYKQNALKEDKKTEEKLNSGSLDPYTFMVSKIKDLEITPGQLGLEPCSGSLVVTDTNTGKVKAMVSYPSYDNNKFANTVDSDYFNKINSNKASPLINRATQQKTAPGSTYKMMVASAALEEGVIDPTSTVRDLITFKEISPSPSCWSTSSHGTINVVQALMHSCNYFFYEMGFRMSKDSNNKMNNKIGLATLKKYAKIFGFTDKSGVEVAESEPKVSDIDSIRSAIGQGSNNYTPIQLSRYVTTIANGGTCYNLTIIDKIKDNKSGKVTKNKAKVRNKVKFASSTWSAIKEGMKQVIANGTIHLLYSKLDVQVAGKTGTAQENDYKPDHALFVSYAPLDDPKISVTAVIANGYTSSNAAELARDIYQYYFDKGSRKKLVEGKVKTPELGNKTFSD